MDLHSRFFWIKDFSDGTLNQLPKLGTLYNMVHKIVSSCQGMSEEQIRNDMIINAL